MDGKIKKLVTDKGFGFIQVNDGPDRFFHASAMADGEDFDALQEGQSVTFEDVRHDKGPRAAEVRPA